MPKRLTLVALVVALVCGPALVRATQQLGHGAKIKQVCGLSTSVTRPPDHHAPDVLVAAPVTTWTAPRPDETEAVGSDPVASRPAPVQRTPSPRAPPATCDR